MKRRQKTKNMNERTYMQIGSRKLRHMQKGPRGAGGGGGGGGPGTGVLSKCRIRWAFATFANLDTLWQI